MLCQYRVSSYKNSGYFFFFISRWSIVWKLSLINMIIDFLILMGKFCTIFCISKCLRELSSFSFFPLADSAHDWKIWKRSLHDLQKTRKLRQQIAWKMLFSGRITAIFNNASSLIKEISLRLWSKWEINCWIFRQSSKRALELLKAWSWLFFCFD